MCYGTRQLNMAHTLTAHFSQSYFNTTLLTDDTTVLQTLVLTTQTFVILYRTENTSTEQTVTLRLERTVVNGFRLFNFTVRPATDHVGRSEPDANRIELFTLIRSEERRVGK